MRAIGPVALPPKPKDLYLDISELWSPTVNVLLERHLWWHIAWYQSIHGTVRINRAALDMLRLIINPWNVDLDSINRRERVLRHDLKARLEETIEVAKIQQVLHLGCTSADIVENVYLMRMGYSAEILGARFGDPELRYWEQWLPFHGVAGPVGTQADQIDLGIDSVDFDRYLAGVYGFQHTLGSIGQVAHRSIDLQWADRILIAAGRYAQRRYDEARPWLSLLAGYYRMITGYQGDTWNEGDISTSVVRRVALPGMALSAEALADAVDETRSQE